jgi:hypothetical protein
MEYLKMDQIKIMLFPSFVKDALDANVIRSEQLDDIKQLMNIFSETCVSKITYLNSLGSASPGSKDEQTLNALDYAWFRTSANSFLPNNKLPFIPNMLTAMTHDGDESLVPVMERVLNTAVLTYTVVRIRLNTYGLVFNPLEVTSGTLERKAVNAIHMKRLLQQGIVDNTVVNSELYAHYISYL